MRFNASEYTTHIFVTALYESDSKQKLLDIKKSHPNSKFIVYGPEIRYGLLLVYLHSSRILIILSITVL